MKLRSKVLGVPSGREAIAAAGLSVIAAFGLTSGPGIASSLPVSLLGVLLAGTAVGVTVRAIVICRKSIRSGGGFSGLGSLILGAGIIFAVVLPGMQLLTGGRDSRLEEKGFFLTDKAADMALAWAIFMFALLAFVAGEIIMQRVRPRPAAPTPAALSGDGTSRSLVGSMWTYGALVLLGIALTVILPEQPKEVIFEQRGRIEGEGAIQLMGYAIPLAISIAVLHRHWGSRWLVALDLLLVIVVLVPGGTRSPLLIVGMALLVRFLYQTAGVRVGPGTVVAAGIGLWVAATLLVGISDWRGNVRVGIQDSPSQALVRAAPNPFNKLWEGGLDTVDGLTLSTKVNRQDVDASWTDPAKVVLGFIPHQVWPEKPEWLGVTVTQYYTNFEAGGIFLSGPGYLLIVFGTKIAVGLGFLLLGLGSEAIFGRLRRPSIWTALLAYFLLRFFFGGDAFDAFHVLGLALLVLAAWAVGSVARTILRRPEPGVAPAPG